MSAGVLVVCGMAGALGVVNAVTMRRVWASPIFERPQKIAQSVLIWLLPGSFVLVRHALTDHRAGRSTASDEMTFHNEASFSAEGHIGGGGHTSGGGGGDDTAGGF
jgi:hypothetical protein